MFYFSLQFSRLEWSLCQLHAEPKAGNWVQDLRPKNMGLRPA